MDDGRFVGYLQLPWLGYLMMAGSVLGSALLGYLFLLSLVNRIVLRVEPGRLRLFNTPLPWPYGALDLVPEDIRGFESTPGLRVKQGDKDLVKPTVIMLLVDREGMKHPLIPGLVSEAQCAWLEGGIRRTLGMPASVAGPLPPQAPAWEAMGPTPTPSVAGLQDPGRALPTDEGSPRSLPERLVRGLVAHGLGYVGASQQLFAVGGHFGWFMMVIIGLQDGGHGGLVREVSQGLLKLYTVLGGVDENGHGGKAEMMEVWGTVSLVIYLVEVLLSRVLGARRPWGQLRKWAASTALACAGYGLAFALLAWNAPGRVGQMLGVIPFFILFTSLMTLWALGFGRSIRFLQEQVRGAPANQARPASGTNDSVRPLLAAGGALFVLGLAAGLVLPKTVTANSRRPLAPSREGVKAGKGRHCRVAAVCEQQCAQGDAEACNVLSELLEGGVGIPHDPERARELATRACEMGEGVACMRMAAAMERGAPTQVDLRLADELYRRSCELKNADGCAGVAYLYEGVLNGPPKDPEIVNRFFARACELGKQEACERLKPSASAE